MLAERPNPAESRAIAEALESEISGVTLQISHLQQPVKLKQAEVEAAKDQAGLAFQRNVLAPLAASVFAFGAFPLEDVLMKEGSTFIPATKHLLCVPRSPYSSKPLRMDETGRIFVGDFAQYGYTFRVKEEIGPYDYYRVMKAGSAIQAMREAVAQRVLDDRRVAYQETARVEARSGRFASAVERMAASELPIQRYAMDVLEADGKTDDVRQSMKNMFAIRPGLFANKEDYTRAMHEARFSWFLRHGGKGFGIEIIKAEEPMFGEEWVMKLSHSGKTSTENRKELWLTDSGIPLVASVNRASASAYQHADGSQMVDEGQQREMGRMVAEITKNVTASDWLAAAKDIAQQRSS